MSDVIMDTYNTDYPYFAYICGGLRRLSVDPHDRRARNVLLSKGINYYSKVPYFTYRCIEQLPVSAFLDIGANYGECMFAVPLYHRLRIHGYEINPDLLPHLEKSIIYNDDLVNVSVSPFAIADKVGGRTTVHLDREWSGRSAIVHEPADLDMPGREYRSVQTSSIDHELREGREEELVLIKMDIQGWEPVAMQGATDANKYIQNIVYVIEFAEGHLVQAGSDPDGFFKFLSDQFAVYKLTACGLYEITKYEDLRLIHPGEELKPRSESMHLDIVLCKLTNGALCTQFRDTIINVDLFDTWSKRNAYRSGRWFW